MLCSMGGCIDLMAGKSSGLPSHIACHPCDGAYSMQYPLPVFGMRWYLQQGLRREKIQRL